ncbi:hypothetical protein MIND_01123600 [Mycena indigotica]|uniref:Uncharacterized protein n=1 Tax=Mycena indigotica TaxID=2126181 RepID=A0A8H6VTL8_9AGAR|nr:uncharacterized protein MIND_01123600 [Mycena indigotica]KAF7293459.1 hypothetical protein MIND_01123600 [Mycena indigotica]
MSDTVQLEVLKAELETSRELNHQLLIANASVAQDRDQIQLKLDALESAPAHQALKAVRVELAHAKFNMLACQTQIDSQKKLIQSFMAESVHLRTNLQVAEGQIALLRAKNRILEGKLSEAQAKA